MEEVRYINDADGIAGVVIKSKDGTYIAMLEDLESGERVPHIATGLTLKQAIEKAREWANV
ncbi:MAG: hypothetical protein ACO24D_13855 [bacterium]